MILTIECPDNFHFVNISFIDQDKSKAVTRSFTKIELMEMDQYIERDNFVGFPADKIDDTLDLTEHDKECALKVERKETNGGPFAYEEWCTCTHCGFRHALFIPRNYCPKCGYKFMPTIRKGDTEKD